MNKVRQNPVVFYLRTLWYAVIALLLRVITFAPLALLALPKESPWRWGALLCPVMLVFLVLPLRYSFADALVQRSRQRFFSYDTAFSFEHWGEKLGESILHALSVAKWALPLVGMAVFAGWYYIYELNERTAALLTTLKDLGKWGANLWYTVSDFFVKLFGQTPKAHLEGSLVEGLYVLGVALLIGILIFIIGVMRNSCNRYIWVAATREDRLPRTEIRRRMRGRRFRQLLVALVNLVLLAPFLVVVVLQLKQSVGSLSTLLTNWLMVGSMLTVDFTNLMLPLGLAFALLYLPLLPVRRMLTATFATARKRRGLENPAPAAASTVVYPAGMEPVFQPEAAADGNANENGSFWNARGGVGYYPQQDQNADK